MRVSNATLAIVLIGFPLAAASCVEPGGVDGAGDGAGGGEGDAGDGIATEDGGTGTDGTGHADDAGDGWDAPPFDGESCEPPDMMIILDRTLSMHRTPEGVTPEDTAAGRASTKWAIAIAAIESVTAELDTTIRFGLELFPRAPSMGACVTLSDRLRGFSSANPECEGGEVIVRPDVGTAGRIAEELDPERTRLCRSTPIGGAFMIAGLELSGSRPEGREQFVLLISDGKDTCDALFALSSAQDLARRGIRTYVVAFDATAEGIDPAMLNDLACAGLTAEGFPASCIDVGSGGYRAADPDGPRLFRIAQDGPDLVDSLREVAGEACCGCPL